MVITALTLVTVLLYLAATVALGARLLLHEERSPARSTALALAAAAVGTHVVVVGDTTWVDDGLNLSIFSALSLVSWITSTGLVIVSLRQRVEHLGILLWPLSAMAVMLTLFAAPEATLDRELAVQIHIVISMTAYATLLAAVLQALILGALDYRLRHRQATGFVRQLPALRTMEKQLFWLVTVGFVALTVALGSGFLFFLDRLLEGMMIHKTSLSMASWLAFATLLIGHAVWGWRGQTAIRWTLVGFLALMFGYFGSKFVLELILQQ
ncbi:MAG: cytochrome c biogenesis protein CcsA [Halorhodospira halophila]|uniref:cytochrome C assembly family protein n=1 Tax=Halorhodospira TaxID=85108 RepID=UPI001EE8E34F|nr:MULTISPECIES: cytochrome c biogenesis protein CcsA [Halorhodospira]MCC3751581.1 cytochrome c biogenesis protein CcsA [Halorhodospira halophila]MCG5539364.1 cytochrome c biogenesis protein CcsA [Halorhodospira sp. 9622]